MSANAECCGWFSCWPRNSAVSTIKQVQSLSCIVNYKGETDTESCLVLPPFKFQTGCAASRRDSDRIRLLFVSSLNWYTLICAILISPSKGRLPHSLMNPMIRIKTTKSKAFVILVRRPWTIDLLQVFLSYINKSLKMLSKTDWCGPLILSSENALVAIPWHQIQLYK